MNWEIAGFPAPLPLGVDFVTYSNEDIGHTVAYAAGSDNYQFALPYPSSMNLWEETMMVFAIDFIYSPQGAAHTALTSVGYKVNFSMLGDNFGANWGGGLADTEDETFKAQFDGPYYFGHKKMVLTGAARTVPSDMLTLPQTQCLRYFPPEPLDLVTPLYINLTNAGMTFTLGTGASVLDDDQDATELMAVRVWFLKRDYTQEEKRFMNRLPTRFQQLDS